MNVLTIDDDLKVALEWAFELALEDQENYFKSGDVVIDYGDEWPEVAATKAAMLKGMARVCRQMGDPGLAKSCRALAKQFKDPIEIETPKKKRGKKNGSE